MMTTIEIATFNIMTIVLYIRFYLSKHAALLFKPVVPDDRHVSTGFVRVLINALSLS